MEDIVVVMVEEINMVMGGVMMSGVVIVGEMVVLGPTEGGLTFFILKMTPTKLESSTAVDDWLSVAWIECSSEDGPALSELEIDVERGGMRELTMVTTMVEGS
eukprot:Gb_20249 [translate_table: standard]